MSQNKLRVKGASSGGTPTSCDSETADVRAIFSSGGLSTDIILTKIGEFNLKPLYMADNGKYNVIYSGGFWYLMGGHGSQELAFANPGNENYPWEATWPEGCSVIKYCS